tara:strand:- start:327 stop:944 length:618 start_codon:yes stop_codon:yes gene_type:complete
MEKNIKKFSDVSCETIRLLEKYQSLVKKWTKVINLISKNSTGDIWRRHIIDSAQIYFMAPKNKGKWLDLGSGGGFPGIVIASIAKQLNPELVTVLVESDKRKSAFLRIASEELSLNTIVLDDRIEKILPQRADVVSARAFGNLKRLFSLSLRHLHPEGVCLFQKGKTWKQEIMEAEIDWNFRYETIKSCTKEEAIVLKVENLGRG